MHRLRAGHDGDGSELVIYFTSDQHFFHANSIKYCNRPWSSVEDMNEGLIQRWNERVKPEDHVIVLGDFSLSKKALPLVCRLNGSKSLIAGNHDQCHPVHYKKEEKGERMRQLYLQHGFDSIALEDWQLVGLERVKLHHMPYRGDHTDKGERYTEWRPKDEGHWLLHGHVHGLWKVNGRMINVGVDVWDYYPVSVDEIAGLIKQD